MKPNVVLLLLSCSCFASLVLAQRRQVGGKDVSTLEYPFVVAITFQRELFGNGAIISKRWILSSASAFYHTPDSQYHVSVAGDDYNVEATWYEVERIFRHPEFVGWGYNIGLLKLQRDLEYTARVNPINLAFNDLATVEGFMLSYGKNEDGTTHLRGAYYTLTSDDSCASQFNAFDATDSVRRGQGYCLVPSPDSIQGQWYNDVGGPIVSDNELYAVFAFSENLGGDNKGSYATRIAAYRDWLMSIAPDIF